MPKLKFIYNKTKIRHFVESLLPVSSVQYNTGGTISLLLARVLIWQRDGPDHNRQLEEGAAMYEVRGTYSTNVQIPRKFL